MIADETPDEIQLLMVEDTLQDAELILRALKKGGLNPVHKRVFSAEQMQEALGTAQWDMILSDFHVPGFGAVEALKILEKFSLDVPFIIVSGAIGEVTAVELMRAGAADFVMKDNLARLIPVVGRELKELKKRRKSQADYKAAQATIKDNEDQFKSLANSISTLAWMAHPDGYTFWYNDRWYEYTGATAEQMEGWGWQAVHDPEILPVVSEEWKASIDTGRPFEMEFPLQNSLGAYEWFLTRANPIRNSQGHITRWFGTSTNIDNQIKIRNELKKAVSLRNDFLSIASHELKTPITSLKLQMQLVRRSFNPTEGKSPSPERVFRMLEVSTRQIDKLTYLIEGLLDVSKIEAGKLEIQFEDFDILELIEEVVERFREELAQSNSQIEITSSPIIIRADRFRIEQVIVNLLTNSMKYGAGKTIKLSAHSAGNEVIISVQDFGIGIRPDKLESIFNRFERAVPHNNISGLGLGLFIAKEIVASHRGSISVSSELNKGSTFTVKIPINRPAEA